MLREIYCDKFHQKQIVFNPGLSVVLGTNTGDNSIGKSTFLLIVDYVFGGSTYAGTADIIENVGSHDIYFTFVFGKETFKFCRNSISAHTVWKCNDSYEKVEEIALTDYCKWLDLKYAISLPELSFRDAVGRYIRVYATLPDSYRDYIRYLFDDTRSQIVCGIIKSMEIEIHNDTYNENLLHRFSNQPGLPPEYIDLLLTDMLGWVTQTVLSFTKENIPAYISSKDYRNALTLQIRACNTNAVLKAISLPPSHTEQSGEVARLDTYIRQLKLIEVDDTTLFEAASDFLRAKTDKIEWAQRGLVNEQSFEDYYDALYRTWVNQKYLMGLQYRTDPISCGTAVYFKCRDDSKHQKLQGIETPPFFGSGTLQFLANNPADAPKIGWHPQYIKLLKEDNV